MFHKKSKLDKDIQLHPHQWHFQDHPAERRRWKSCNVPHVPAHCVFQDVSIPYPLSRADSFPPSLELYPTPGHVASHLLLLECFQKLHLDLDLVTFQACRPSSPINAPLTTTTSTRWLVFMTKAFKRFRLWISNIESILRHSAAFNRYGTGSHLHGAFTENYLPPLDVLLVWYYYQQHSNEFQQLISDNHFRLLEQLCFPWHLFPSVIDQDTLAYELSVPAQTLWRTFVGVPVKIEDCSDLHLDDTKAALSISVDEFLDVAKEQVELLNIPGHQRWLRSPSLEGTLRRGLQRYESTLVPSRTDKCLSISSIHLDAILLLIMQTHRTYPAVWQSFLNQNRLDDDSSSTPPPYSAKDASFSSEDTGKKGVLVSSIELNTEASTTCFCWICERVRDELDLNQYPSPTNSSHKGTQPGASCSPVSTNEFLLQLKLSQDQIRFIKADVDLYRSAEVLRSQSIHTS